MRDGVTSGSMADENKDGNAKPTAGDVSEQKPPEPKKSEEDVVLPVSRYIDEPDSLGFAGPDIVGAFAGVDPDTEVTRTEAKKRVREYLRAPVQTDPQE